MERVSSLLKWTAGHLLISEDGTLLCARTALPALGLDVQDWPATGAVQHDFGAGPELALRTQDFALLAMTTATQEAQQWRVRSAPLLAAALNGDTTLAAQVTRRAPDSTSRRWLAARLESREARRELLGAAARSGGQGEVFRQLGSLSNRSVLGMDSAQLRQQRGVKHTRDGLTSTELLRLAYLDRATTRALESGQARGNAAIVRLHQQLAQRERQLWEGSGWAWHAAQAG